MSSRYADRIDRLAKDARTHRETFNHPDDFGDDDTTVLLDETVVGDDETCALTAARDGLGPVVGLYVEARTAAEPVRFSPTELARLHAATNDWLAIYTRCHGVTTDPDVTVREAAEVLVDTHDITEVAALLTGVPER